MLPRMPRGGHRTSGETGGGNAGHLRRQNLERILAVAMDQADPFTRAELIRATGLSAPTVGSLVGHLSRIGLIRGLGTGPSRGGRRPASMEFNARHGFAAGIDLGPTKTRLAVADLRGERLAHRVIPTPAGVGPTALLKRLAEAMRGLLQEASVPVDRLLAVGAGAPGAVDWKRGVVVALASNLEGDWSDVPMAEILRDALGAPVVVENDVNLAVLGERWRGAARGHETCAFITIGTGIGAGVVVDGALHRGHHFLAGEIGFMCMGQEYVDRVFPRGCLETLAGLRALAARFPRGTGADPGRDVAALFEAAQNGDAEARAAVLEVATLISIATANLSLALDPSLIVLGGALVTHEPLVAEVRRIVGQILPTPTEIAVSTLGTDAPLWGALLLATHEARERLRQRLRDARGPSREVPA